MIALFSRLFPLGVVIGFVALSLGACAPAGIAWQAGQLDTSASGDGALGVPEETGMTQYQMTQRPSER